MKVANLIYQTVLVSTFHFQEVISFCSSKASTFKIIQSLQPNECPNECNERLSSFNSSPINNHYCDRKAKTTLHLKSFFRSKQEDVEIPEKEEEPTTFVQNIISNTNPPYATAYIAFIVIATVMSINEPLNASQEVIQQFIDDPIHPSINELFTAEFNLLGLIGLPMSCMIMPNVLQSKQPPSILSATPFLFGSCLAGYGSLGIYMSTYQPDEDPVITTKSDLGFFTRNLLENKIFNWFVVATITSTFFVTGTVDAFLSNPQELISGYKDVLASSALGFVSTVDLFILSCTAASLIPRDLKNRMYSNDLVDYEESKGVAIALSTLLLPVVGVALYCALRPKFS